MEQYTQNQQDSFIKYYRKLGGTEDLKSEGHRIVSSHWVTWFIYRWYIDTIPFTLEQCVEHVLDIEKRHNC